MARNAFIDQFVIGIDGIEKLYAALSQRINRFAKIAAAEGDMLDTFAFIGVKVLGDLTCGMRALLVDRDANFAARAG